MKTQVRHCKRCRRDTRHDVYADGMIPGEPVPMFERLFFGACTFGLSEMLSDTWCECQVCGSKKKLG